MQGEVRIHAKVTTAVKPGVLIAEGLWPNKAHLDGEGINVLTGAEAGRALWRRGRARQQGLAHARMPHDEV
jgi:anaerobic selenocysteine-containing dehydrogenase